MSRENDIGFAVRMLSNAIKRDVEKAHTKLKIEHPKGVDGWAINYFYENRGKDVFQKDFEEKFSIRRSTASRMLKNMEQKGFIKRESVEFDARLKKITLTEKAEKQHKLILESIKKREERLRNGLSEQEVKIFLELLKRITHNMEEQND